MKNTFGSFVKLIVGVLLCLGIVTFGAITVLKILKNLDTKEAVETGTGWENIEVTQVPAEVDNTKQLVDLCQELEIALEDDEVLHTDTMLGATEEYVELWESISAIQEMGEEGLSNEEWLLYEKLKWSYELYEAGQQLPNYSSVLSDITGVLNKLPEVFYTWQFKTEQDIINYQEALKQIPDILDWLCAGLEKQYELGMTYSDSIIQDKITFCKNQCEAESIFGQNFESKVLACDFLAEERKEAYIAGNQKRVQKYVCGSFEKVIQVLEMSGEFEGSKGLCLYVRGKEYFEYILKMRTGTEYSVQQMYDYLEEHRLKLQEKLSGMDSIVISEEISDKSVEEMLSGLYKSTITAFPKIEEVNYETKEIPEGIDQTLYLAFYMKDSKNDNFIFLSKNAKEESALSLYQTLAHEAFPGHMYNYNFVRNVDYPNLMKQLKCLGNSEGWAIYAEIAAGDWIEDVGLRKSYEKLVYQKLYDEIVLCQIDIGIHAFGWTLDDIESFSKENYGYGNQETAQLVMETLVNNPGAYEAYVIGYYELIRLKEKYCMSGEVSEYEFLEAYQKCGQAPFSIVDEYMEKKFSAHTE